MSTTPAESATATVGRRLAVNTVAGIASQVVQLVARIAVTPFALRYIPLAEYGLWTICFVILSYAGLSAFGVNNAYVRYTAEYLAAGKPEKVSALASTGFFAMTALSGLLFTALSCALPFFLHRHGIDPAMRELAGSLILWSAAAFLAEIAFGAFRGVLEGAQELALVSLVCLGAVLFETVGIFVLLPLGCGVRGLLYAYVAKTFLLTATLAVLAFERLPGLRIRPSLVRREALRLFFVFGGKVQILGFLGIFIETFDRVVATSLLGLEATGLLEVGRKFPNAARGFSGAAFGAFLPAASSLGGWWEGGVLPTAGEKLQKYVRLCLYTLALALLALTPLLLWRAEGIQLHNLPTVTALPTAIVAGVCLLWLALAGWTSRYVNKDERFMGQGVRDIFLGGTRHICLINFTVFLFLAAVADRLLFAWVGPGYDQAALILAVVALSNMIHQGTGPGTYIFRGIDRTGKELEYMLVQFVLVLVWIPSLSVLFGLFGAALGFSLAAVAASLFFFQRACRALGIPLGLCLRETLVPGLAPALAALPLRAILIALPSLSRWGTALLLLALGLGYCGLTVWLLKRFFLRPAEWAALSRQAGALIRRGRPPRSAS